MVIRKIKKIIRGLRSKQSNFYKATNLLVITLIVTFLLMGIMSKYFIANGEDVEDYVFKNSEEYKELEYRELSNKNIRGRENG